MDLSPPQTRRWRFHGCAKRTAALRMRRQHSTPALEETVQGRIIEFAAACAHVARPAHKAPRAQNHAKKQHPQEGSAPALGEGQVRKKNNQGAVPPLDAKQA